ncbi:MAG: rod-binding protein [Deltaproteobacteria bacterium]|jgi:flagellar protein FlgJ|nr:rod-binding protein [Deltaproteobacteria bacterium]
MENGIKTVNPLDLMQQGQAVQGKSLKAAKGDKEMKKACSDFEAMFLTKMLESMRKTIPKSGLLDGGKQEEIYTYFMDENLAKLASQGKGTGLGQWLYKEMSKKDLK